MESEERLQAPRGSSGPGGPVTPEPLSPSLCGCLSLSVFLKLTYFNVISLKSIRNLSNPIFSVWLFFN